MATSSKKEMNEQKERYEWPRIGKADERSKTAAGGRLAINQRLDKITYTERAFSLFDPLGPQAIVTVVGHSGNLGYEQGRSETAKRKLLVVVGLTSPTTERRH